MEVCGTTWEVVRSFHCNGIQGRPFEVYDIVVFRNVIGQPEIKRKCRV